MTLKTKDFSTHLNAPLSPYQKCFLEFCTDKTVHKDAINVLDDETIVKYQPCYKTTMYGENCWVIDAMEADHDGISWIEESKLSNKVITQDMITTSPMSTSDLIAAEMEFVCINDDYLDMILEYWDDLYMDESIETVLEEMNSKAEIELASSVVSELNNWLEANGDGQSKIVSEMGFGFNATEPSILQYICGGDIVSSKYNINDAKQMIENEGLSSALIDELQQEAIPVDEIMI